MRDSLENNATGALYRHDLGRSNNFFTITQIDS